MIKNQLNSEDYWEVYHDNGKLWYKGNYVNGIREGYWEWLYSNGKLSSKEYYYN